MNSHQSAAAAASSTAESSTARSSLLDQANLTALTRRAVTSSMRFADPTPGQHGQGSSAAIAIHLARCWAPPMPPSGQAGGVDPDLGVPPTT